MTSIVTNANAYQFALGKQTNGTTPLGTASYAMQVFDANIRPVAELARIDVTDASSIQGDPYKKPTFWEAEVTVPGLAASLGPILQSVWPTDGNAGTAPTTHTFSGLGGTQSFFTVFDDFTNADGSTPGTASMRYGNGIASSITFACDKEGGPLKVSWAAFGSTPAVATYSVTTTDTMSNGYFGMQLNSATIEMANATPNANPSSAVTNVEAVSVTVARTVTPAPTADGVTVANLAQGKVEVTGSMTFLFNTWQEWKASYFGSVTGSTVDSTIVYGALDLNFKHSVQSTWGLEIYCPKVTFKVPTRQPDASGGMLKLPVELGFAIPASGDVVQPILVNGVTTSYSA